MYDTLTCALLIQGDCRQVIHIKEPRQLKPVAHHALTLVNAAAVFADTSAAGTIEDAME